MARVSINEETTQGYYQVMSTDTKPTQAVADGAMLKEIDTGRVFEYSNSNVNPVTSDGWWEVLEEQAGYGVFSGLNTTEQATPDMTVKITDGRIYLEDGSRFAVKGNAALAIDAADDTYNRQDLIYVDSNHLLRYIAGDITVAGVRTYTITVNAASGDTFTINETTLTEGVDFNAGVDEAATATNLAAALDTALDGTFSASADGAVITVTEETPGGGDTPSASTIVGTMEVTDGTAIESVTTGDDLPATPAGGIDIAKLNVDASTTAITTAMITKLRAWTAAGVTDA
ncbi:MAG TPA: hypothetical protein PLM48_08130 [Clostridia bacterium]|nr:hypothetical protein [Clostridia bacterium]